MMEPVQPGFESYPRIVKRLGFPAAITAAVLGISWAVLAIAFPAADWSGVQDYASTFRTEQIINVVPAFLLAPTMVVVMSSLHFYTPPEKRVFTLIGLSFTTMYAALIPSLYYLQMHTVRLNLLSGDLEGIALLALPNFHSIFMALDTLGYGFLSLGMIFASVTFSGGRLQNWLRWLFLVVGAIGVFGILIAPLDQPWVMIGGGGLWALVFPIAMLLLAWHFQRGDSISSHK
jgi:hypothetical protein